MSPLYAVAGLLAIGLFAYLVAALLKPEWFSTAHVFVWQSAIILFGVLLWVLWVQRYAMARDA